MAEIRNIGPIPGGDDYGNSGSSSGAARKPSDKLAEYISGNAEIPEDEAAAKMRRKIEARTNRIEERKNASYTEADIKKAIGNKNSEVIFYQLLEFGIIGENDDGTYNITNLSDIFSEFTNPEKMIDRPGGDNKVNSAFENIKYSLEKRIGADISDKTVKRLAKFAGFDVEKKNLAIAAFKGILNW